MLFDQYSRYKACADLLHQADFAPGKTVIDIGSGPECLFGQFVNEQDVTYIDPLISSPNDDRHICGDVFSKKLDGRQFSFVTAVDVYEHVPPASRQVFLERLSSLAADGVILAFPSAENPAARETDQLMDQKYAAIYGNQYPWLKEHHEYGLPSLADTCDVFRLAGWHVQTVGHGYVPWLQELLGFVICVWDIPELKDVVLAASKQFNEELAKYDFSSPHYRDFVIASRSAIPKFITPKAESENLLRERFSTILNQAKEAYFAASLHQLALKNGAIQDLNLKIESVSTWGKELHESVLARDATIHDLTHKIQEAAEQTLKASLMLADKQAELMKMSDWAHGVVVERDSAVAVALANLVQQSASWRLARPLRFVARLARYGLTNEDRQRLTQALRQRYHRLPLPVSAKRVVSFVFHKVVGKTVRSLRRSALHALQFHPPSIKFDSNSNNLADYIVWGVIDWHFRHQRPQQLAVALANTGRRVFYISPNLTDDERAGFEVGALDDTGLLFQIKLFVKGAPVIYSSAPSVESIAQLRASIGEVLEWANSKQIISMVDHPFWYDIASVLPNSRLIYDCMDHHEGFGNNADSLMQLEKSLLSSADLTITTSSWLDDAVAPHARRRALIRNAGDYDHFCRVPDSVYRDPQGRRIIGYYGAIAEWFDLDLIEAVARQYPECCVLLIGADTVNAKTRLAKLPNVTFTGEVPYSQLPYYLYGFDVCLLPFKVIPLTLATNPVKAYEYLSAGKPVVAVDLPEMTQFEGLVYAAADKNAFLAAVGKVLSQPESDALVQQRKTFAQGQTWRHRVEALMQHAKSAASDPKISVVVVTYNNLDFTRACLASLDEHSQYEHLEIIVVDNASSDGSPAFLSEWVAGESNRKLILNEDNRGFAAANNQGLEIATGDYLVMLNNDTYVTPGWVRTLVRHLERDKTIGLIGPVTNNIGNEAKIDIAYSNMDAMLLKSAAFTRRHIGQTFPLRTAAFFCVMMPRTTYSRVGTLDEVFGRGFFEDDDYCRRIEQLGLRVVCAEDVFVHHHLSASFNKLKSQDRQKLFEDNKATYEAKWGEWTPHSHDKTTPAPAPYPFETSQHLTGRCNVCGNRTRFFYTDVALWRESLNCEHCRTTSRYRSITRGILRALDERAGVQADSLTCLPRSGASHRLRVYDTQPPFYYDPCAYPLPDLLKATGWIDVELSQYKPKRPMGEKIAKGVSNQNLEYLTFDDESLDIVITSDVMEHVRLDVRAHKEIHRVLKPGGIYIFTVPHNRAWDETLVRVQITDPEDPSKDVHLLEPEYHGDTNSDEGGGVLAYRTYGRDIEIYLQELGFEVEYFRADNSQQGILNTELYYCRKIR